MKPLALLLALPLLAQDDGSFVFRSDVLLVRVDAQVRDRSNRAITGLRAEDFVLREQGKVREIRNFAREDMPMDVLMLLDVSASMRTHVERIASAAHQAFQSLGPEDRVGIMVFDRATRVRMPFRPHRGGDVERGLDRVLDQEDFNGGTDITRGIYNAIDYVKQNARREARRAVVILTDDQTEFHADENGLIRSLARNDIVLSLLLAPDAIQRQRRQTGGVGFPGGGGGIGWPGNWPSGGGRRGPVILGGGGAGRTRSAGTRIIAEDSGGDSMNVDQASALEDTLTRLRQRYALHFYLPEGARAGQEREVSVDLSAAARRRYPDAEVRYRRSYVAPESNGSSPAEVSTSTPAPPPPVAAPDAEPAPPPRSRRRVSDPNSGSGTGPLIDRTSDSSTPPSAPAGGWPKTDAASKNLPPVDPVTAPPSEKKGGWPRVK